MANPSDWCDRIEELQTELEEHLRAMMKQEHPFATWEDYAEVRRILDEIDQAREAFDKAELEDDAGYMILPKKES